MASIVYLLRRNRIRIRNQGQEKATLNFVDSREVETAFDRRYNDSRHHDD